MKRFCLWLVIGVAALPAEPFSNGHAATLIGMGSLPNGEACFPTAVSANGTVVAGSCRSLSLKPAPMAFTWTRGEGLRHLAAPLSSQALPVSANAMSRSGDAIVGSTQDLGQGSEGYLWRPPANIIGLGNEHAASSIPMAIAGDVVVGMVERAGIIKPFHWSSGAGLRPFTGFSSSLQAEVNGMSADGRTIVGRAWWTGSQRMRGWAFRWTEGDGIANLERSREDDYNVGSRATAVSGDGMVVVGDNIVGRRREAFRWTVRTGMVSLGVLAGEGFSEAHSVTDDGQIIVGQSGTRPFWWDGRRGLRDLRELLESEFGMAESLRGWRLENVTVISADGHVLAGQGVNPAGEPEGWIIDLH
jgi:uncharacterized membrane protein